MRVANISFLLKGGNVILAKKLKKFGAGCLNGYGGKSEEGESPEEAAMRELEQESGVRATIIAERDKVAVIDFFEGDAHIFKCHVYFVKEWQGEPKASEEMGEPEIFPLAEMPFEKMWPADRVWLPLVVSGKKIKAKVRYTKGNGGMEEFTFTEHERLD